MVTDGECTATSSSHDLLPRLRSRTLSSNAARRIHTLQSSFVYSSTGEL
jgi:hypothetical protein